jgi:hypothetical protein
MKRGLIPTILLLFSFQALAAWNCLDITKELFSFSKEQTPLLTAPQLEEIQRMGKDLPGLESLPNRPDHDLFYILSLYRDDVLEQMKKIPLNERARGKYLKRLSTPISAETDHFSKMIFVLDRKASELTPKDKGETLSEWITAGIRNFNSLDDDARKSIIRKIGEDIIQEKAILFFRKSFHADLKLITEGKRQYIQLKDTRYPVISRIDGDFVIGVPRSVVAHPAWNPYNSKKAMSIIADGTIEAPKSYYVNVGLDGKFYLLDGNHRFDYVDRRDVVPVRVTKELKTTNLRIFLDDIGVTQPDFATQIKIMNREVSPYSVVPEFLRKEIIWKEEELRQIP